MSVPELVYFDGAGRAELTRSVFAVTSTQFTDTRLTFQQFGEMKGDRNSLVWQRFGSVPLLKHGDLLLAQSIAIAQYAAELSGLTNKTFTAKMRALDNMLVQTHADVQSAMYECLFGSEESKAAGVEALPAAVTRFLTPVENLLPQCGFLHGRAQPSLGDMAIHNLVVSPFPGLNQLGQDLSSYPKITALSALVTEHPAMVAYAENKHNAEVPLAGKLVHSNENLVASPLDHAIVAHSTAADDLLKHMTADEKDSMEELSTNQALGYLSGCAFVGHTNTDMDSIGSAYGASQLFQGTFTRASDVNTESKFALDYWDIEVPPLFQDTDEKTRENVCLVDHNQTTQMACGIVQKNVRGIIDHHAIQGNCVTTPGPIYVNIQPWGSACSIVANMYVELGKSMNRKTAGILLSGILSDTLNLRSPTTTDPDRLMVALLCKIARVRDANDLAKKLFKAKSKMCTTLTAYQLLNGDLKAFSYAFSLNGDVLFGVVEAETSNLEALKKTGRVAEIRKEMRALKQEKNAKLCFFALVDIFDIKSELVICGPGEAQMAEALFEAKVVDGMMDTGARVSRKKQFVPPIEELLSTGWTLDDHSAAEAKLLAEDGHLGELVHECTAEHGCTIRRRHMADVAHIVTSLGRWRHHAHDHHGHGHAH